MGVYFGMHGRFCASHPWEVIVTIVTLTVSVLSMSVISGGKVGTVCGFSKSCQPKPTDEEVREGRRGRRLFEVSASDNLCLRPAFILSIILCFSRCV